MIQPLRAGHRRIWSVLGISLPALFAAGIALRPPAPPVEQRTDRVTFRMPDGAAVIGDARELWGAAIDAPDPLVYWTPAAPADRTLGPEARLAGSLEQGRRDGLQLPGAGGRVILYSLAHGRVLAVAPVPKEMP